MKCPVCKKVEVAKGAPEFPFCSERCRTIDLGNWAMEKYVISEPIASAEGTPITSSETQAETRDDTPDDRD
jgi:endogenous inhibitor of DNA gyrase (YacG/DUF329 family)